MARIWDQYAVVETNNVASVRTGQIKAQYPVADGATEDPENGMLLVVSDVNEEISFPTNGQETKIYLHASEERIYQPHLGRSGWVLDRETQIPKMLKLSIGDTFETNAVDDGDFANLEAVEAELAVPNTVFGIGHASGLIELKNDSLTVGDYTVLLVLLGVITLPNGEPGMKFAVVRA